MGIFNKVKKAFGFGGEYEEEDDPFIIDATVQPRPRTLVSDHAEPTQDSTRAADDTSATDVVQMPPVPVNKIFATVVDEFNKSLPSFLSTGIDADAQRQHLYDLLDADVKSYLDEVSVNAREQCNQQWDKERKSLKSDIESLQSRLKAIEESGADKGKQLLSAERQKRALTERIHDLEAQVSNLEAEKDQYELETRSLVNKLRVSNMLNDGVAIPDVASYEQRIEELQAKLTAQSSEIEMLTADNNTLRADNDKLLTAETELKGKVSEVETQNTSLSEQLKALQVKTDMTDVMLNDLNNRAATATKTAADKDTEIESLRNKLKESTEMVSTLEAELDEARANLEIAASIQDEVERIQKTIESKNTTIAGLNDTLRRRDDRINALEAEEASLRRTIEANLHNQAVSESELRENISRLEEQLNAQTARDKNKYKRKPALKISAIDEDLDNTDWLVAVPPEGVSAKTSGVSDAEFGYQEPQRKTPPENSAQMSLW